MTIFFILANLIFSLTGLILIFNLRKAFKHRISNETFRAFSILIAAKNEESNIFKLISALKKIDYPENLFEVIIVDDNSDDNTYPVTEQLISDLNNFHLIKTPEKSLPGKKGALEAGIKKAKFGFIMITDADCEPSPGWLKAYNNSISEESGILFGIAPFHQKKNLVNLIACFENLRNSILALSLTEAGLPYSAAARNFGFSKNVFTHIGGYNETLQTLSGDDDLLIREAVRHKIKVQSVTEPESEVFSETKSSFGEYFAQRSRHLKTSAYYLSRQKFVLAFWHLLNLSFFLSPVFVFISPWFFSLFIVKILYDEIIVLIYQKRLGYSFNVFRILYLQIFYEIFLVSNFILSRIRKDSWK